MPCAMMHLMCARLYDPEADIVFYVGNEAPDCMDIRELKDKSHFRIYTNDREEKFSEFVRTLDLSNPYHLGVVLHLYADMLWDAGPMAQHKLSYTGENWFTDYRDQIRMIGSYMYRNLTWAEQIWSDMCQAPVNMYDSLDVFPKDKIQAYLIYNRDRNKELKIGPSPDFPNELVERFCVDTVNRFKTWIRQFQSADCTENYV